MFWQHGRNRNLDFKFLASGWYMCDDDGDGKIIQQFIWTEMVTTFDNDFDDKRKTDMGITHDLIVPRG